MELSINYKLIINNINGKFFHEPRKKIKIKEKVKLISFVEKEICLFKKLARGK
jgi:hypothetical protein